MMAELLMGLGLVAVFEGLVLALAPLRFEELLERLRDMDKQTLRAFGLGAIAVGVFLIWIAKNVAM